MDWFGLNRTMCDVLNEMRDAMKTLNFSYLSGLIEEAQSYANRMEAGLSDQKDLAILNKRVKKLKKELDKLKDQRDELKPDSEEEDDNC